MRSYLARLEGEPSALVSLRAGPVQAAPGLGLDEGRAPVVIRYALPDGRVRVHRGWLWCDLPAGTGLKVAAHQLDGDRLLLSLGPIRPTRPEPERWDDRFRLPFALQAWGCTRLDSVALRLRVACRVRPGAVLLRGRLLLELAAPGASFSLAIPFCRLVSASCGPGLEWRAYGRVVGLSWSVSPGGAIAGEATLAVTCLGNPPVAVAPQAPAPAFVRDLGAEVIKLAGEVLSGGKALVSGAVSLEIAWADRSGKSRWTGREIPFSTLVEAPGLAEGDQLEVAGQVERLNRVGDRVALLLAVGVTGLRPVHLALGEGLYRSLQVVGQGVACLPLDLSLFESPEAPLVPHKWHRLAVDLPAWEPAAAMRLRLKGRSLGLGEQRLALPVDGSCCLGLAGVGPAGAELVALDLPEATPSPSGSPAVDRSQATLALPGALLGLAGLSLVGAPRWEGRLLAQLEGGAHLLCLPCEQGGAELQPHAATAYGQRIQGEGAREVRLDLEWRGVE